MAYDFNNLPPLKLSGGKHESIEQGTCFMELVAFMAGEPHSDHPKCACPLLTDFGIRINDHASDEDRQKYLLPLVPMMLDTRDDDCEAFRGRYIIYALENVMDEWNFETWQKRNIKFAENQITAIVHMMYLDMGRCRIKEQEPMKLYDPEPVTMNVTQEVEYFNPTKELCAILESAIIMGNHTPKQTIDELASNQIAKDIVPHAVRQKELESS